MADFPHSQFGNVSSRFPGAQARLKGMIPTEQWGGFRDQIAQSRAGVPGASGPDPASVWGYDEKTPEGQRFLQWLIQSLMDAENRPGPAAPNIQEKGITLQPGDEEIVNRGTAGQGYVKRP